MIYRLGSIVLASVLLVALLPRLAGQEDDRLARIAETRGAEYRTKIQSLARAIATGKAAFQFPLGDAEEELVARSAGVRVIDPYLDLWLNHQFERFIQALTASDMQQRAWAANNPLFEGMFLEVSFSEIFAFYASSADLRLNGNWAGLPFPAVVDPVAYFGSGPRHESTYIAMLESIAFQPYEWIALPWEGELSSFHHSRAFWMVLAASYLIEYAGNLDDHLRILATEVLYRRIGGPETPSIIRAVWIETYAALVPDVRTGAMMAEGFLAAEKPLQVIAGARAAYVLIGRSESKEFRLRLRNKIDEASLRVQEPTVKACLEHLVGVIDKKLSQE